MKVIDEISKYKEKQESESLSVIEEGKSEYDVEHDLENGQKVLHDDRVNYPNQPIEYLLEIP